MSNPLKTLNQLRAEYAYRCVMDVKEKYKNETSRYKTLAKKLPQRITYNGLLTTLAFLKSKTKCKKERNTRNCRVEVNGEFLILAHLVLWLENSPNLRIPNFPMQNTEQYLYEKIQKFLKKVYENWSAQELFLKTSEALAIAQWLKRIAEGELDDSDTD